MTLTMRPEFYILNDNGDPIETTFEAWVSWMAQNHEACVVAQNVISEKPHVRVSTVFLGRDQGSPFDWNGPPILFETMVFADGQSERSQRYCTREEALRGHSRSIDVVLAEQGKDPMGHKEEMEDALRRASAAIEEATWSPLPDAPPGGRAFLGLTPNWRFTVMDFDIEPQGFPAGSRGYDGAGVEQMMNVLHLTRELAEKAFKLAVAQTAT
jgi:hypothetical protein